MKKFFNNFKSLDAFTLSLEVHNKELKCPHCHRRNQFVSHGVIYRQNSITSSEKIGKRIFCSNRYGRAGCGRTVQLYVKHIIPALQYNTSHFFLFLCALINKKPITVAFQDSSKHTESRQAWRWINRLTLKIMNYRQLINPSLVLKYQDQYRSHRFQLILPTISALFDLLPQCPCSNFQLSSQSAFI